MENLLRKFQIICTALIIVSSLFGQIPQQSAGSFGDELVIGHVGPLPEYIHPYQIDTPLEKLLVRLVYGTGLFQNIDRFGQPPTLIENIRLTSSMAVPGLVWHYTLKRNIDFHNSVPLRNSDVKFTFEILKRWGGNILNRRLDFSNIENVQIIGDLEIIFYLKEKNNFFYQSLYDFPILSQDYYEDLHQNGYQFFKNVYPLGYGPFIFEPSRQKNVIQMVYHHNYAFGPPFLNRIVFKSYTDEQQMIDDFLKGDLDLIEVQESVTAKRIFQILQSDVKIFRTPRPEKKVYFVQFNINTPPFNNPRIRTAIKGSINQNDMIKNLVEQTGHVAYSLVDFTHVQFYKDLIREQYQPSASLEIFRLEGWQYNSVKGILEKEGKNLSFELLFQENSLLEESIARSIKIYLAELGINVLPKPVNLLDKRRLVEQNRFMAALDEYTYSDEDIYQVIKDFYFRILKKENATVNYSNVVLERLFRQADANPSDRKLALQRFQTTLYRETPAIFLYFDDKIIYAVNSRFHNIWAPFSSDKIYYYRLMPFENWFVPRASQKYPVR